MSPELAVALGAAVGAPARHLVDRAVMAARGRQTPAGILAVNLLGCLATGVLVGLRPPELVLHLLGVGVLGSFTTASTVAWDVLTRSTRRQGLLLLALHVVPGLGLVALGLAVGRGVD